MFYRQKVLLALIQAFGGVLESTDLEKLLFLYCKFSGTNHYDFFPHKFGAFSHISYFDKRKLTRKGLLKQRDEFSIDSNDPFSTKLKVEERLTIEAFARQIGSLRGRELIRQTYLEYPQTAARSEIAQELLSSNEFQSVVSHRNLDESTVLFTIGYEGISIDAYLDKLIHSNVHLLVDVRKNPLSRKHGFSKKQLSQYLRGVGIEYWHIPELGINSHLRKSLNNRQDYQDLFEHYSEEILPTHGNSLNQILSGVKKFRRVALTCFEAEPSMCHRHKITESIKSNTSTNFPICHL